VLEEGE
jgi:hypothetical protein